MEKPLHKTNVSEKLPFNQQNNFLLMNQLATKFNNLPPENDVLLDSQCFDVQVPNNFRLSQV